MILPPRMPGFGSSKAGPPGPPGKDGAAGKDGVAGLPGKDGIPAPAPSQSAATRALNTAFMVSDKRPALVSYSIQLTVTAAIAGGQQGDVILEIASNQAFTTNVQTIAINGLGQTYSLAVAIQGVQPQTGVLSGLVPAGYYARMRTMNVTGNPVFNFRAGQETLL